MMDGFIKATRGFIKEEDAQALVEYALLLFVFTMVSYAGIKLFMAVWKAKFNKLKDLRAGPKGIYP